MTQTTPSIPEYIERIKAYRARTGATLHDAKKAVDANRDKPFKPNWKRILGHLAGWSTRCILESFLIAALLKWVMV